MFLVDENHWGPQPFVRGESEIPSSRNADPIEDNDPLFYNGEISGSKDNVVEKCNQNKQAVQNCRGN